MRKSRHNSNEPAVGPKRSLPEWLARALGDPGRPDIQAPESKHAERIVEALITQASCRAEIGIAILRMLFTVVILVRFMLVNDLHDGSSEMIVREALELPVLFATMSLSGVILARVLRHGVSQSLLDLSAILDALATSLALLPGVLQPWPTYLGLLRLPDLAILPVICVSAGLRFSRRTAILGALVNSGLFGVLIALDLVLNRKIIAYSDHEIGLYLTYMATATVFGVLLATRARALAQAAACYAERAETARNGLTRVLQDNHDVRSLMSSARINADLVARSLEAQGGESATHVASALRANLGELAEFVAGSRDRAYLELAITSDREATEISEAAHRALQAVARRFPSVAFQFEDEQRALWGWVVGGCRGLERVLLNLLVNASEGNGDKSPTQVRLSIGRVRNSVALVVSDDGPGFPENVLVRRSERFASTKKGGSGLGLFLVESIVLTSGGQLFLENTQRGARVTVLLALASETRPPPVA